MQKLQKILVGLLLIVAAPTATVSADDYLVELVRAKPGHFKHLLAELKTYNWERAETIEPIIMRHSLGDQWDLFFIGPTMPHCSTDACEDERAKVSALFRRDVAYFKPFIASSDENWDQLKERAKGTGIFYVEMFTAVEGKQEDVLAQRRMENAYLDGVYGKDNSLFTIAGGSDFDSFTIGYFRDMVHFGEGASITQAEKEVIAKAVGFKDLDDISFSLRAVITSHNDTLATPVN